MASNEDRMLQYLEQIAKNSKVDTGPGLNLGSSPKDFKDALTVSKSALTDFGKTASNSLNVWRDLSKTGAAFSNDIIGMSTAAAQSRMSLDEFSKVIRDNGKHMTGLGGSVGRGAEVFSKLSKSFFDSNLDRGLREMGYTSKELNEVLALTAGAQKSAFSDTKKGQDQTNEAAAAMAKEMDLIAKLTGKSRAEQMDEMAKRKVDGQAEAKLRQLTAGKSDEEAAKIRNEYQKGLLEAQKQGTEQSYKEFFATGTYLSEGAATQRALLGKQIAAQEDQIKAIQQGDVTGALEARQRSAAESLKNQTDNTLLTIATFGSAGGAASEVMLKQVEVNDALFQSVSTVKKEYEAKTGTLISFGEALKIARDKIEQEQLGKDKEGQARSGATEGLIAIEKAQQDFKAGLAGAAEALNGKGESLANALRDTGTVIKNVIQDIEGTAQGGNIGKNVEDRAKAGQRNEAPVIPPGTGKLKADEIKRDAGGGAIGDITRGASTAANKGVGIAAEAVGSIVGPNNPIGPMRGASQPQGGTPIEERAKGGPVDAGTPYLVGEDGKAEIFVPKSAGDIVPMDKIGTKIPPPPDPKEQMSFAESMAASVKKGMQTVGVDPNMRGNPTSGMDGFDLSSISKDISTTISSVTGGGSTTTKQVQNDESKAAEKELKSVKEQYAAERESLLQKVKEKLGPDAKSRSIRTEMREGDEGKALEEKYKALIGPLEKQIESGIKWEVETKQAAAKETKTAIESELLIKEDQAEALARINENRKKINTDETKSISEQLSVYKQSNEAKTEEEKNTAEELARINENRKKINEGETKSISEQLSVYKQSNEAKTEEEKNTAEALARINENRKKINTDETTAPTSPVPIIKQDQLNKPIENPLLNDKGKISLNKLNLPGMPDFGKSLAPKDPKPADPKGAAASISEEARRADAKKAEEKKKIEDAKKAEAAKGTPATKPTGSVQQTASLNDVVKSLDQLNMQMGKLISQQSDLIRKQTSSMLAAGSNNVYDKTR